MAVPFSDREDRRAGVPPGPALPAAARAAGMKESFMILCVSV